MRPPSIETARSARSSSRGEWLMTIVVRPRMRLASPSSTCASLSASRPVVGSSRIRMAGSRRSVRAIAMRCRWPPESPTPRGPSSVS